MKNKNLKPHKLSDEQRAQIVVDYAFGDYSMRSLAKKYGLKSPNSIFQIIHSQLDLFERLKKRKEVKIQGKMVRLMEKYLKEALKDKEKIKGLRRITAIGILYDKIYQKRVPLIDARTQKIQITYSRWNEKQ